MQKTETTKITSNVHLNFENFSIGRRTVVFPSILLLSLFGILSTYAQDYYTFLILRFFEGFFFTVSLEFINFVQPLHAFSRRLSLSGSLLRNV